jgi:holo-[acyl-carrier protein] synthase
VIGIGSDLVELGRFRVALARTPTLAERLFSDAERAYAAQRADPTERLAVRFAAKEAVMKALGVGIGAFAMHDVEVVRADSGQPSLVLRGAAAALAAERGVSRWLLTLTHTERVAQAVAVAL